METITKYEDIVDLLASTPPQRLEALQQVGEGMGSTYTDHGLPVDMAMSKLKQLHPRLSRNDLALVLFFAQSWIMEHRHASGATEKAIERLREQNRKQFMRFIKTGEVEL